MPEDFSDVAQHGVMKGVWNEDGICRNVFQVKQGTNSYLLCSPSTGQVFCPCTLPPLFGASLPGRSAGQH